MNDRWAVALAAATAVGAAAARGPSPLVGALLVGVAVVARRPWLLCIGAALLASGLAARSWAGLDGAAPGPFDRVVTLVSDPETVGTAVRVDVAAAGRRYEAWVRGPAATTVAELLAGERVALRGRVQPAPDGGLPAWVTRRHVAARLAIDGAGPVHDGSPIARLGNGLRRTLMAGATGLPADQRSLLAGLVVGDDRAQPAAVSDEFEAAGLVHLLAVSGQNVAFVLALVAPLLTRLGLRARLVATIAVLGFFGLVTRFEPSVLRATAMATVATVASTVGREASSVRLLAIVVTGLLLVDPLLVGAVGFQLSVGASLGIVSLSGPLARRIPLPGFLARPLSVTLAAQVGVAPVLVPVFGGVPLASVPANLLAVPAAGPVMMWGLTGGLLAGIADRVPGGAAGETIATALHLPSRVLLAWIAAVAHRFGTAPLGELGAPHLVVIGAGVLLVVVAWRSSHWRWRGPAVRLAVGLMVAAAVAPAVVASRPPPPPFHVQAAGLDLWRRGDAVVVAVTENTSPGAVLETLRDRRVRHIDVLVVATDGPVAVEVAGAVHDRFRPQLLLAPAGAAIDGATTPDDGLVVAIGGPGGLELRVALDAGQLHVEPVPGRALPPGA